jgi:hypothetical protein
MTEPHRTVNSVCAQKVRNRAKGRERRPNESGCLKLNPSGVEPTLVHDESSLILCCLDDT